MFDRPTASLRVLEESAQSWVLRESAPVRILLFGETGVGKSTLAADLARSSWTAGRSCACVGADPGSPAFGVPGAICRGEWDGERWITRDLEAVCTLDAGRFRLPLVSALGRLLRRASPGILLIDAPGVVCGVAGAELLLGLVEIAEVGVVLALAEPGREPPLAEELAALSVPVLVVPASVAARRLGKRARARHRTGLWNGYLGAAVETSIDAARYALVGSPPPAGVDEAWRGRQIAFLDRRGNTLAFGEVSSREGDRLRIRLPRESSAQGSILLVRDARRDPQGWLCTARPSGASQLRYYPPPDMAPRAGIGAAGGARPVAQLGPITVSLVNGVLGDPVLHVRLRQRRRSLLFDLGETGRLPARIAHQVTDVFLSHGHFDHIAGFLWLLRSRIGDLPQCRVFGPPGTIELIDCLVRGIVWDRVGIRGPRFEIAELHGERMLRGRVRAGRRGVEPLAELSAPSGLVLLEPDFGVRATVLDHGIPVLAFAFESARRLNIRKQSLMHSGLPAGPWLNELKERVKGQDLTATIRLPDGSCRSAGELAEDLVLDSGGVKLVYAADLADTPENRSRLIALAAGAHVFFCEAAFLEEDAEQAKRTGHLTARACGEIASGAQVEVLVPFHFSRRYEGRPEQVYREVRAACPRASLPDSRDDLLD